MYENLEEVFVSREIIYEGQILSVERDQVRLCNEAPALREVVRHSGGVAVLALGEDDTVTMVEQYRYPLGCVIRELPAGKLDAGDGGDNFHLMAAKRELEEETGLVEGDFTYLGYILASPGYSDEVLHMYLAQNSKQGVAKPDGDEFLNVLQVPFDDLVAEVMSGNIVDGKSVATILKVKMYLGR